MLPLFFLAVTLADLCRDDLIRLAKSRQVCLTNVAVKTSDGHVLFGPTIQDGDYTSTINWTDAKGNQRSKKVYPPLLEAA